MSCRPRELGGSEAKMAFFQPKIQLRGGFSPERPPCSRAAVIKVLLVVLAPNSAPREAPPPFWGRFQPKAGDKRGDLGPNVPKTPPGFPSSPQIPPRFSVGRCWAALYKQGSVRSPPLLYSHLLLLFFLGGGSNFGGKNGEIWGGLQCLFLFFFWPNVVTKPQPRVGGLGSCFWGGGVPGCPPPSTSPPLWVSGSPPVVPGGGG